MLLKPSHYRSVAKESLSAAHRPGRVILIHTGVVLLLSLVLTLLDYFLDRQISNTGGLSGMDQRSFMVTVQSDTIESDSQISAASGFVLRVGTGVSCTIGKLSGSGHIVGVER